MIQNFQDKHFASLLTAQQRYNAVKALALLDEANTKAQIKNIQILKFKNLLNQDTKIHSKFRDTISFLSEPSAMIIENEFINKDNSKDWYDNHFSKATYYKKRRKAIEEFLYFYLN